MLHLIKAWYGEERDEEHEFGAVLQLLERVGAGVEEACQTVIHYGVD